MKNRRVEGQGRGAGWRRVRRLNKRHVKQKLREIKKERIKKQKQKIIREVCFAGGCNRLFEGGPWHSWERSCLIQGDGLGRGFGKRNKMISISVAFPLSFKSSRQKYAFALSTMLTNACNPMFSVINVYIKAYN